MNAVFGYASALTVGLTAGNYIYQAVQRVPAWETAMERSFFQFIAIAALAGLLYWNRA